MKSKSHKQTRLRRPGPLFEHEAELVSQGYTRVAGIDEAGRGALAGPVVAAAVILDGDRLPERVRDSKLVPEPEREQLYDVITHVAVAWGVGIVDSTDIDRINILQATLRAMLLAVDSLPVVPTHLLVDGRDRPGGGIPCRTIIGGDASCISIAAASIIAKVTRDRIMRRLHDEMPHYGFDRNKGYGTAIHRNAILEYGPSPIHRISFLGKLMQEKLF
jgi:ribonuclease HII